MRGFGPNRHRFAPASKPASTVWNWGNFGDHKSVGGGVSELRLAFGPGYRLYYGREGSTLVILLGGGTKARQARDIATAQACWQVYKQERRHARQSPSGE